MTLLRNILMGVACWVSLATTGASAQSAAEFYKDRVVTFIIGADAGGTYDVHGRLLARHFPHHIPGAPRLVVQNMPGAGSVKAANNLYSVAPQDGSVLSSLLNTLPLAHVLDQLKVQADITRLQWIGNMAQEVFVVLAWHTAPARTIEDVRQTPLVLAATSSGTLSGMLPRIINHVLGTKFQVVTGYSFAAIDLAMERQEVHGHAGAAWISKGKYADLVRDNKVRVLLQIGFHRPSELAAVPLLRDMAKDDEALRLIDLFASPAALGKPMVVGPDVPADRVALLRQAYDATMRDPAFLAEADKVGVTILPVSGVELGERVKRIVESPPALVARAKAAIGG